MTSHLTGLPTELLDKIISCVLPEGFESLALTCKAIHALCTPFIEHHNILRSYFQNFNYYIKDGSSFTISTAWDLIIHIAIEPIVARYVRDGDFKMDSYFSRTRTRDMLADIRDPRCGEAVAKLLANSPHLKQADLDWKEFYAKIEEDLEERRYSQHAAAFLLTLLPNINSLKLPRSWKLSNVTDKLLNAIVRDAKRSDLPLWDRPSLSQLTRFEPSVSLGSDEKFHLNNAIPFLALPRMRSFYGPSCVAMGDDHIEFSSKDPYRGYGETLEVVNFESSCLDEVAIADFLKHTPCLKTLKYSHTTKRASQDWDICKFVTAIEREAGNHIEELSISIRELRGSIPRGKASIRRFQHLRKLEFPLELAISHVAWMDSALDEPPFIDEFVPSSVSQLSLLSSGKEQDEKALDTMFRHFALRKEFQLPALKEIFLSCPEHENTKERCANLIAETKKVGVELQLDIWPAMWPCSVSIVWDGEL